jgi:di/tricarboxylate transporter
LATTTETAGRPGLGVDRDTTVRRTTETKHATKTTELYVFVAAVVGVLIAASQSENLDARGAWQLVTALAIGYMLSRGLAKSGSREAYTDRD